METEKSKYNRVQWLKFVPKYEPTNKEVLQVISLAKVTMVCILNGKIVVLELEFHILYWLFIQLNTVYLINVSHVLQFLQSQQMLETIHLLCFHSHEIYNSTKRNKILNKKMNNASKNCFCLSLMYTYFIFSARIKIPLKVQYVCIQNQEEDAANQTPLCVHSKNASTKLLFKNKTKVSLILRTPINHTFQIPKTSQITMILYE